MPVRSWTRIPLRVEAIIPRSRVWYTLRDAAGRFYLLPARRLRGLGARNLKQDVKLDGATRQVLRVLQNARQKSIQWKLVHFVVLTPREFVVFQDKDKDAELDPDKDRIVYRVQVDLHKNSVLIITPAWLGCDWNGKTAWSTLGPPPTIELRDMNTGARVELKVSAKQLGISKITYYGPTK